MSFKNLRSFLDALRRAGDLHEIIMATTDISKKYNLIFML